MLTNLYFHSIFLPLMIDSDKIKHFSREILKKVTILLRHIQGALEMQGVAPGENNSWQHQA
jgi:hypothetical protein